MENNKEWMKKPLLVVATLLSLFLLAETVEAVKGYRYIGGQNSIGSISVAGKGEVIAVPDIATFSFSVSEESPIVATAQSRATEKMNGILDFLKKSGVEDKDVKTTNYNIYPRYEYPGQSLYNSGTRRLAGYVVSQSIEVKVRDIAGAGQLLSGIGEFGATDVSSLSFSVDKIDELMKEAREKAIKEARSNAKKLASDLGVRLVRVMSYYDNDPLYPFSYGKDAAMGMGGDFMRAESAPRLPSGENKIISNVNIVYEIR